MKLRIQTFTTSLTLAVILLAGCAQKNIPREIAQSDKAPVDTPSKQVLGPQLSDALPTTFSPPENPYEDITINGQAPPFEYYGNAVYWVLTWNIRRSAHRDKNIRCQYYQISPRRLATES